MALLDELTIDTPVRVAGFAGRGKVVRVFNVQNVQVCMGGPSLITRPAADLTVIYPESRPLAADGFTRQEAVAIFGKLVASPEYAAVRYVVVDGERGSKSVSVSASKLVDGVAVPLTWTKAGAVSGKNPPLPE